MRPTPELCKKFTVRKAYEHAYKIPFQDVLPIELRDRVSNKAKKDKSRPCIAELTIFLQCFKDNDFSQKRCAESMKSYYTCVDQHYERKAALEERLSVTDVKRVKDLSAADINQLLKNKPLL